MKIKDQKLYYQENMPKGREFYHWIFSIDSKKEDLSFEIYQNDKEFDSIETYETIPQFLQIIYKVAVCGYGCKGGPHVIEYISGRGYNLAIASIKLIRLGFYDEAISLIRSISEIVNLFALFCIEANSLKEWYEQSERERIKNFSPSKVRQRLSKTHLKPPISKEYYSKMCEIGVHVNPMTKPQGKNNIERALVGGFVIEEQAIAVQNDLAYNLVWLAIMSLRNSVDKEIFIKETDQLSLLYDKIGSLSLESLDDYLNYRKNGS